MRARMTGSTTSGTVVRISPSRATNAMPTRARQLHWATRSSQAGTISGRFGGLLGRQDLGDALGHAHDHGRERDRQDEADQPGDCSPIGSTMRMSAGWTVRACSKARGRTNT